MDFGTYPTGWYMEANQMGVSMESTEVSPVQGFEGVIQSIYATLHDILFATLELPFD